MNKKQKEKNILSDYNTNRISCDWPNLFLADKITRFKNLADKKQADQALFHK